MPSTEKDIEIKTQLSEYCEEISPGYAVLIDAPWGCGKTHFIKDWASRRKDTLYVSIYGIASHSEFEAAILERIIQKNKKLKTPRKVKMTEESLTHLTGINLGLSDAYRKNALRAIPRIIIIDDIERSELAPDTALGIINDKIEHHGKNVIILSSQIELEKKWQGRGISIGEIKEKVVGQVLTMEPNCRKVISHYNSTTRKYRIIPDFLRRSRSIKSNTFSNFLAGESELIERVFTATQAQNLRALKRSLRSFEKIFDPIVKSTNGDRGKMKVALATFLALSIMHNKNTTFNEKDLRQELNWRKLLNRGNNGKDDAENQKYGIDKLRELCNEIQEVRLDGSVISGELANMVINRGHYDYQKIEAYIRSSHIIGNVREIPWRVLWSWLRRQPSEVSSALKEVINDLKEIKILDPVIMTHTFCILKDIEKNNIEIGLGDTVESYLDTYLERALRENKIPTTHPKGPYRNSFTEDNNTGLGFYDEGGNTFKEVKSKIEIALDKSFWSHIKADPSRFIRQLRSDPFSLMRSLDNTGQRDGAPNYAHIPVLGYTPPSSLADALIDSGPETTMMFLDIMEDRITRLKNVKPEEQGTEWPDEHFLLTRVKEEYETRLDSCNDPIAKAQISRIVTRMQQAIWRPK